jgi:hypothetical protein
VIEERLFSSMGIRLGTTRSGSPTNNLVANNFIYNIRSNGTGGDQPVAVGISGGNGDRVVFNSISLTGDMDPGAAGAPTTYGNAIRIPGANAANNANFTIGITVFISTPVVRAPPPSVIRNNLERRRLCLWDGLSQLQPITTSIQVNTQLQTGRSG